MKHPSERVFFLASPLGPAIGSVEHGWRLGVLSPGGTEATMIPLVRNDPRHQPLAYISDGTILAEVIGSKGPDLILEDCCTGERFQLSLQKVRAGWELVKAAPSGEIDVAA